MTYLPKRRALRGFGDDPADLNINADIPDGSGPSADVQTTVYDDDSGLLTYPTGLSSAANWVTSTSGVCKPANAATLSAAKDFQRAINRCLDKLSTTKITVDGAIGSGTMGALSTISSSTSAGAYSLGPSSVNWGGGCTVVVAQIDVLTTRLNQLADWLGAPSSVGSPAPSSTPTFVNPVTGQPQQQGMTDSLTDFFQNMSTMEQAGIAALAVGIGYFAFTSFGKKK